MKNQTYDLINSILAGIFIIILFLLATAVIFLPIKYIIDNNFRSQCLDNNKTYFEFKTLDGFPISGKYCGDLNELKELIEKAKGLN